MTQIASVDFSEIREAEVAAKTSTLIEMRSGFELARRLLQHALAGLLRIESRPVRSRWYELMIALAARSFNSLYAAHELVLSGFAVQAWSLIRSAHEDFITAAYVNKNHRAARYWMAKKYQRGKASRQVPRFAKLAAVAFKSERRKAQDIYGVMSQFAHPRSAGLELTRISDVGDTQFILGPVYDRALAFAVYYYLVPELARLVLAVEWFVRVGDQAWSLRARDLLDESLSYITEQNKLWAPER
jgi:Family of unknown function (DUF5677)